MGTLIHWKLNQDYIAKNLCVNIDKPKMGCKGKCQLDKRLMKIDTESSQEKTPTQQTIKISAIDLYFEPNPLVWTSLYLSPNQSEYGNSVSFHYSFSYLSTLLKPPISVV